MLQSGLRNVATCFCFFLVFVLGGTSLPQTMLYLTILGLSASVAIIWLPQYLKGIPNKASGLIIGVFMFWLLTAWAQLVPLPYNIWSTLPGRDFLNQAMIATGQIPAYMPLSLAPEKTMQSIFAVLPGLAFFTVGNLQTGSQRPLFAATLVFGCLVSLLLAIAQKSAAPDSVLLFYSFNGEIMSNGTFINRNNFATALAACIPFVAALGSYFVRSRALHFTLAGMILAVIGAALLIGIMISTSRTGLALGSLAVLFSIPLLLQMKVAPNKNSHTQLSLVLILVAVLVTGIFLVFGADTLLRLTAIQGNDDSRLTIWRNSLQLGSTFFPVGSGYGTFVPLYQMIETPRDMLQGLFINHAHNDFFELILEGGLPMMIVLCMSAVLLIMCAVMVLRKSSQDNSDLFARAALVTVLLLLLHSMVEFPLRNAALLSTFGYCLGLVFSGRSAVPFVAVKKQK
jgi:O-antigen ligase